MAQSPSKPTKEDSCGACQIHLSAWRAIAEHSRVLAVRSSPVCRNLRIQTAKISKLMPRARRTKRFWVIRWKGDQVRKDFFHVLPATRTSKPILDYMIGLYFNSPSLLISERMNRVHSTLRRNVKNQDLGTRIIVGDNPFLVAYEVEDLVVVQDPAKGVELVSYTELPAYRVNKDTGWPEPAGLPQKVQFERRYSEGSEN
jgi:hypothetical protein